MEEKVCARGEGASAVFTYGGPHGRPFAEGRRGGFLKLHLQICGRGPVFLPAPFTLDSFLSF